VLGQILLDFLSATRIETLTRLIRFEEVGVRFLRLTSSESLLAAFSSEDLTGKRILLARAAIARDTLPAGLRTLGAHVDVAAAYRTLPPGNLAARARELLTAPHKPDWITFTSSSTVENLVAAIGAEAVAGIPVASIGPVTSATARRLGIHVTVEASQFDEAGLIEAILAIK